MCTCIVVSTLYQVNKIPFPSLTSSQIRQACQFITSAGPRLLVTQPSNCAEGIVPSLLQERYGTALGVESKQFKLGLALYTFGFDEERSLLYYLQPVNSFKGRILH